MDPSGEKHSSSYEASELAHLFAPPPAPNAASNLSNLFESASPEDETVRAGEGTSQLNQRPDADDYFAQVKASRKKVSIASENHQASTMQRSLRNWFCQNRLVNTLKEPTTWAGSFMFLLYHVVFTLACGSAITRPHSKVSILGVMTKLSCVGILFAGPLYILRLNDDIPAVYPSIDLFLAPFLAEAAAIVDSSLYRQYDSGPYPDELFFGSFAVLTSLGMFISGLLLYLGSTFKLANLGTFLPYSVLSGFFSAVGVLLWCLAFSVDTRLTWKAVFFSGDWNLILDSCMHHLPSLFIGILMNKLGPMNPFFVIALVLATQVCFFVVMFATGTTLEDAQDAKWFWSPEELVYDSSSNSVGFQAWTLPPAPFGSFGACIAGQVNWTAVAEGLPNMVALGLLYLLRSSIHASAMKKNVNNLVMRIPIPTEAENNEEASQDIAETVVIGNRAPRRPTVIESMRQSVRIVNISMNAKKPIRRRRDSKDFADELTPINGNETVDEDQLEYTEKRANAPRRSLESIFSEYAYALFAVSLSGGFAVCPTVATSNTMYAIGADGPAPQYGSIILLVFFYITDFNLVRYIPKAVFSSLLVLGAVDTLVVWFFGAFRKTLDITEWLVVPVIAAFSLFVGFLNAVFLGIGISMFVFVGSFFRVGVVKFNANGTTIRSRIERSMAQSAFLNDHGDSIQVLVLQGYLFFGNASNVSSYISTMFEEVDMTVSQRLDFCVPPMPRIIVVDLSLVTGMDTSTVDIFGEIKQTCENNECKLFLCGLSHRARRGLELGGVKPDRGQRSKKIVRFFVDLDTALGSAEDSLIQDEMVATRDALSPRSPNKSGFRRALKHIDELHGEAFADKLLGLQPYTSLLTLEPGECLYACDGGVVEESLRGLFFIEEGLLKLERDSSLSLTWTRTRSSLGESSTRYTLENQHARIGTLARHAALCKPGGLIEPQAPLRLARIGPGWVCGTMENAGVRAAGVTTAVTACRLYHLPFVKLEEIEKKDPVLVLTLYKMMANLMAHREETTIEQLSTLSSILNATSHSKPVLPPRSLASSFQ